MAEHAHAELLDRLRVAEETLDAIRRGEVDALVVHGPQGDQVYTLSGAERPYRIMFEKLRDGAISLCANGGIVYANSRFAAMVGAPLETVIGRPLENFVVQPQALASLLRRAQEGEVREELELRRLDERTLPVSFSLGPAGIDADVCVCGIVSDLTEQRFYRQLQTAEERLRLAIDATGGVAYEFGSRTSSQRLHGVDRLLGEKPPEGGSLETWWRERTHPDDLPRLKAALDQARKEATRNFSVQYRIRHALGHYLVVQEHTSFSDEGANAHSRAVGMILDITERQRSEEHRQMLLAELTHRVKNALAVVQAIAHEIKGRTGSVEEFYRAFEGRLRAMAQAHGLLTRDRWETTSLRELIQEACRPFASGRAAVQLHGPDVVLVPEQVLPLNLIMYELATNAVKHGSWSSENGFVSVSWDCEIRDDPLVRLRWTEHDGPAVATPLRSGFGTHVLTAMAEYELDGRSSCDFAPEGFRFELEFPGGVNSGGERPVQRAAPVCKKRDRETGVPAVPGH